MVDHTGIEWTDETWNPVTGCSKVSPGCAHCYAEELTKRYAKAWGVPGLPWTPQNAAENVILKPRKLDEPLRWRDPRMVFVNSMSDLFHEQIPDSYIDLVFAVMAAARHHTFQVLTKRPERMREYVTARHNRDLRLTWESLKTHSSEDTDRRGKLRELVAGNSPVPVAVLPNVWLGVSIENRQFVRRADLLRDTPAAVRFISAEPLLGPLVCPECKGHGSIPVPGGGAACPNLCADGSGASTFGPSLDLTNIDWLIAGGESGPRHRAVDVAWLRDLRDACLAESPYPRPGALAGRPAFFFKQWGGATAKSGGNELDGRKWLEIPTHQIAPAEAA